jgi:hypothetical protein
MRFKKHSLLAKAVFTILASINFLTVSAAAEDASGRFVLTHEVRWGTAVLPAGEYTYKLEHHSSEWLIVRAASGAPGFMMMVNSISSTAPGKPDSLQLQKVGDAWFVQSMKISGLEEELHFRVLAPRTEVASTAGSTKLASLSKP